MLPETKREKANGAAKARLSRTIQIFRSLPAALERKWRVGPVSLRVDVDEGVVFDPDVLDVRPPTLPETQKAMLKTFLNWLSITLLRKTRFSALRLMAMTFWT